MERAEIEAMLEKPDDGFMQAGRVPA
jgi:hypothetical protein